MPDAKISALTDGGYARDEDVFPVVRGGNNYKAKVPLRRPHYVANRFYFGLPYPALIAGTAVLADNIMIVPMEIHERVTINALAFRFTTPNAAQNFRAAVYAPNPVTGLPTGNPLATVAETACPAAAGVNEYALSAAITLDPGIYWVAYQTNSSTAIMQAPQASYGLLGFYLGSATLANLSNNTSNVLHAYSVAQAYGTWPDLTSASLTEVSSNRSFAVIYKVSAIF